MLWMMRAVPVGPERVQARRCHRAVLAFVRGYRSELALLVGAVRGASADRVGRPGSGVPRSHRGAVGKTVADPTR